MGITLPSHGDKIISRKPHPCGSTEGTVVRTGADFKLKGGRCGRIIMLPSTDVVKFIKRIVENE